MKLFSPRLEQKLLVSITDGPDGVRNFLLSAIREDHFGYEPMSEAYTRIMRAVRSGEEVSSARLLAEDLALSDRSREVLRKNHGPGVKHSRRILHVRDARKLVRLLDRYRLQRITHRIGERIADEVSKKNPNHDAVLREVEELLLSTRNDAGATISHLGKGDNSEREFAEVISDSPPPLIPIGWKTYDEITGGFGITDLSFIAANYGGGKTTALIAILLYMYTCGYDVLLVSIEMSKNIMWKRIWSCLSGVDFDLIRRHKLTEEQRERIRRCRRKFRKIGKKKGCRFSVFHPGRIDPWQLYQQIKPYKYKAVGVDYINLMEAPPGTPNEERIKLSEIARLCKIVCGEDYLNCAMIILAQLNDENRIKYARAMAEHADNILWWRYGEKEAETHLVAVNQDKARNSSRYKFLLKEDFPHMRFEDMGLINDEESRVIPRKGGTKMANTGGAAKKTTTTTTKKKPKPRGMKELLSQ